jgi:hypothetical protein
MVIGSLDVSLAFERRCIRVNIEKLERPIEPVSATAKGN